MEMNLYLYKSEWGGERRELLMVKKNRFHYYGNEPTSFFVVFLKEILRIVIGVITVNQYTFCYLFKNKSLWKVVFTRGLC